MFIMSPRSRKYKHVSQKIDLKSSKTIPPSNKWQLPLISVFSLLTIACISLLYSRNSASKTVTRKSFSREELKTVQRNHQARALESRELKVLQDEIDMDRLWDSLRMILIPRTPGSDNITLVNGRITNSLQQHSIWYVSNHTFLDTAPEPYGRVRFRNILASTNPNASRKLIFACHYDSKVFPESQQFVGATDSAVPCAMLLEIAHAMDYLLSEHTRKQILNMPNALDISLDLIFFDGEEAFVRWTNRDSIYGARKLAEKWRNTDFTGNRILDKIDLFVLLDLIGHQQTSFVNFRSTRTRWFDYAKTLERRLIRENVLSHTSDVFNRNYVLERHSIEDDHIPFLREGVPIMHLISVPFPSVWHTPLDNENALSRNRIEVVTRILVTFVAEYLHLLKPPK